ncbi:MAG: hypothetical protein ACRC4Y_04390 [Cetobacterium sp.]
MAGIKGMRTGGFGGRKTITPGEKRDTTMTFKVSEREKKIIKDAKGNLSLTDFILSLIEKNK